MPATFPAHLQATCLLPAAAGNYTLAYDSAWGWVDANCGAKLPFLCKMISLTPASSAAKPAPYVSKYSKFTYLLNTTAVTQREAEQACNMQGAHLASYMALEEQVGNTGRPGATQHSFMA
jgi:hypothetical protein